MARKKTEPEGLDACTELVRQHADLIPAPELVAAAASILEVFGYVCVPPPRKGWNDEKPKVPKK